MTSLFPNPFLEHQDLLNLWRELGKRFQSHSAGSRKNIHEAHEIKLLPKNLDACFEQLFQKWQETPPMQATRHLSQNILNHLKPLCLNLWGGSADLTQSNGLEEQEMPSEKKSWKSENLHFGIREHGMAAIMNGMALHGTVIPYGGTFLCFSDYMRPAIRLSALMKQRVIYIMSHDSIGLGEDGPTHQPVEHLASLRAIPHLSVMRPGTAIELLVCWYQALHTQGPTILCLSRQNLKKFDLNENDLKSTFQDWIQAYEEIKKGAYVFRSGLNVLNHQENLDVVLWSSGTELGLACIIQKKLWDRGITSQVNSVPCWLWLEKQSQTYLHMLRGGNATKTLQVIIEAAHLMGWERFVGSDRILLCGINDFGCSAPYEKVYDHFGLNIEIIVKRIVEYLK
jgi:transketolase